MLNPRHSYMESLHKVVYPSLSNIAHGDMIYKYVVKKEIKSKKKKRNFFLSFDNETAPGEVPTGYCQGTPS